MIVQKGLAAAVEIFEQLDQEVESDLGDNKDIIETLKIKYKDVINTYKLKRSDYLKNIKKYEIDKINMYEQNNIIHIN